MKPFTIQVEIARSIHEVFAFLANSENAPHWYEAVKAVRKLTRGVVREGSRYEFVRLLPVGTVVNEVEIVEYEPDCRITLRSRSGPTPFTYRYCLDPSTNGTRLTLTGSISGEGLGGPSILLAPLAPALFAAGMRKNLLRLKAELEKREHVIGPPLQRPYQELSEGADRSEGTDVRGATTDPSFSGTISAGIRE